AYTVQAWATVQENPPVITLHWKHDPHAIQYEILMRNLGDNSWNDVGPVAGADSVFADSSEQAGTTYEYEILDSAKSDSVYAAFGFVASGIDVQLPVMPGKVILLVDKTYSTPLASEISRWINDLQAEGWGVIRHDVNRTDAVPAVKALIEKDYLADSIHVRALFILGHVPVPYSGDIAPDGHTPGNGNHQGAWPADIYYGNFYTHWTDTKVNDVTAGDSRNKNVPGDGKFDQDSISTPDAPEELEVGRVDLYDMPSFTLSDTALMKQYLDRDHAFRTGAFQAPSRALIDDNFGVIQYEYDVPGSNGWRNLAPLVGADNLFNSPGNWFGYLDTAAYLWAYGCGGGWFQGAGGVGNTGNFASQGSKAIFNMLFGSFFGDWDVNDNFLRAPLATSYGLTNCWAGRPYWYFHPLGMGETFGFCTKLTQNVAETPLFVTNDRKHLIFLSDYIWSLSMSSVHIALMGDPTLRMTYLSAPPTSLSASIEGNTVKLTWQAPSLSVPGYNIYRSNATGDTLLQINTSLVTATTFTDLSPLADSNIYVVRAAALTTTPSGSWWNESGGVTQGVKVTLSGVAESNSAPNELTVRQEPGYLDIHISETNATTAHLGIVDETGREINIVHDGPMTPGEYNYRISTSSMTSGGYFVRLVSSDGIQVEKVAIIR
ncbi:MAG TPA: fibronectin type III domain-containing protein, partial [Candidatus Kapabacteria bacterium]|nr:fibronectin type III domain-containing protein [Candidatus Kapabacteria bacterium]